MLSVQVSKEPLLDLIPDATLNHVLDLNTKPEPSLSSVSLVDFTPPSDLIPTSVHVSAFKRTYPVDPSAHETAVYI